MATLQEGMADAKCWWADQQVEDCGLLNFPSFEDRTSLEAGTPYYLPGVSLDGIESLFDTPSLQGELSPDSPSR